MKKAYLRPFDLAHAAVDLSHGGGGRAMQQLIGELFAKAFDNEWLRRGDDGAVLPAPGPGERLVVATDAHVVSPLFFPGGDIGCLSVHGTINDVAMMGARPLYLAASFILEEGFPLADLARLIASMGAAAREAGVPVVTGDTKVVEKGKADGVFISTTGVGALPAGRALSGANARPGDAVLVSGAMGDHGLTVMGSREGLSFLTDVASDSAPLNHMIEDIITAVGEVHVLRDPTRGGLATTLNEIAGQSGVVCSIEEASIPIHDAVRSGCDVLGLDPLYLANEGKMLCFVPEAKAQAALDVLDYQWSVAVPFWQEIDALATMGVSRILRLVLPKVAALAIVMPLLVIWCAFAGIAGGMVAANLEMGLDYGFFLQALPRAVPVANLWIGIGKGFFFGLLIALIACHFGLKVRPNTESLSARTTSAVVTAITVVILVDALFAILTRNVGMPGV